MEFRSANEEDLDRLVDIHFFAYPEGGYSDPTRRRHFTHNPLGGLHDVIVAEHRGSVVAQAFLFPLRASFGGRQVRVGGVASVAVAPEARGRGVATALMDQVHAVSDRRGDAVTMLYAFRQGFYSRFGYGTTSSRKRLTIDARSIPSSWRTLAKTRVRVARGNDRSALRNVHSRMATRSSGLISRPPAFWEIFLAKPTRLIMVCERASSRAISGYVAFDLVQEEEHSETTIEVAELIADDDESRRALFGSLSAMRDQVSEIIVELPEADPLERALVDPDARRFGTLAVEHGLGEVVGGPMMRIEDIPRALEARGYVANGSFDVVVSQSGAGETELIAAGVRVRDGRAEVGPARGGGALRTSRSGLAAIFYGGLSVTDAVALGLAEVDARIASRVDAIARLAPLAPIDVF
jgi:predicted acetyltransferase